ncbi:vasodilator-stimulated phosphoprotein-like [Lethenteron reissneri]|uniref:vasodilator-stimulated phosphoprotein-like n=1 Tax=Lethenteron reissneri TaxID=7753 RepID=UPI002AB703DB|nr:vasodilator-stimulated phosphoprotein-like [Lethenteron reissneri]
MPPPPRPPPSPRPPPPPRPPQGALGKRTMALKRGGGEPEEDEEEAGGGRVPDAPVKRLRRGPGRRCRDEGVPARRGEAETGAGKRDPAAAAPVASGRERKRRSAGRRAEGGEVERAKGWRRVRLGNSAEETSPRGGRAEEEDEVECPLVSGDDGHGGDDGTADGEHVAGTPAAASSEAQTSRYKPGVRSPSSPPAQGIGAPRLGASGIAGAASPSMSSDTDPDALTTFTIEDIFMEVQ